jgi:prepilin-type N-terminal cleavage/methylation domain-containing protein
LPRPTSQAPRARAFTLIELLVTILIIAILMGLLIVGFSHAIRGAKGAAETQTVASLDMAVQQFQGDYSFLPPLVKDGFPGTPDTSGPLTTIGSRTVPNVYNFGDVGGDLRYLRADGAGDERYRFSVYSLSYYLMGALGSDVDGVEGPGAKTPSKTRDGSFDRLTNETYEPLFDAPSGSLEIVDAEEGRIELRDRKGIAYRYYRWATGTTSPNDDDRAVLNVPELVAAGAVASELGDAKYAIVAAGPDGLFGQIGVESFPGQASQAPESLESLAAIEGAHGKRYDSDAEAEAAARGDNIVGVGR